MKEGRDALRHSSISSSAASCRKLFLAAPALDADARDPRPRTTQFRNFEISFLSIRSVRMVRRVVAQVEVAQRCL